MRSLVGLVRAAGSSLLITSETTVHGLPANAMDGLVFLFDNVIDLSYIEDGSRIGRAVHVAKMRNSSHQMTLNSVSITDRGLVIGNELEGVTGRLGWSALRTQGPLEFHFFMASLMSANRVHHFGIWGTTSWNSFSEAPAAGWTLAVSNGPR